MNDAADGKDDADNNIRDSDADNNIKDDDADDNISDDDADNISDGDAATSMMPMTTTPTIMHEGDAVAASNSLVDNRIALLIILPLCRYL